MSFCAQLSITSPIKSINQDFNKLATINFNNNEIEDNRLSPPQKVCHALLRRAQERQYLELRQVGLEADLPRLIGCRQAKISKGKGREEVYQGIA